MLGAETDAPSTEPPDACQGELTMIPLVSLSESVAEQPQVRSLQWAKKGRRGNRRARRGSTRRLTLARDGHTDRAGIGQSDRAVRAIRVATMAVIAVDSADRPS